MLPPFTVGQLLPRLLDVLPTRPLARPRASSSVPDDIHALSFTALVLQPNDAPLEVAHAREVISPLFGALLATLANGVEGLKLPPGVLLHVERFSERSLAKEGVRRETHRLSEIGLGDGLRLNDDRVAEVNDDLAVLEDVATSPVVPRDALSRLADK